MEGDIITELSIMVINHKKKYVFVCNPKTGSTTIKRILGFHKDPPPHLYHISLQKILKLYPEVQSYYKFVFVRNPYERFVSTFIDLKFNPDHQLWANAIKKFKDVNQFAAEFQKSNCRQYIHFQPQIGFIDKLANVDFIGKMETFHNDLDYVLKKLQISNYTIPKLRTTNKYRESRSINDKTKKIIQDLYLLDFKVFKYEF